MVAPTNPDAPRKDDTVVFEDGVYRPGYKDAVQPRGWTGAAWDTGIDVAKTAIDVLQSPVTLLRDATAQPSGGDVDAAAMAQGVQHGAIDAKKWLNRRKTAYGQEQDELAKTQEADEKGWLREAGEALVSSAPAAAAAYFGGPLGAAAYGAVSAGTTGLNLEEQLRDLPPDALAKTDKYKQYRERGFSDEQAKQRLYADMRDAGTILPDLVANTVFGGVAGRAISKLGSRGVAQSMRDRILKNVALDVPEGVIGGALSGSATEYSRQQGLVQAGLQDELDTDAIQKAGIDIARPVGVITGAIAGARSIRRPGGLSQHEQGLARQRTGWEAQQAGRDVQTRMAESAPPAKDADELGLDLRLVAANNLDAGKPQRAEMPGPEQAQAGRAGEQARAPWSPVEPAVPPQAPAASPIPPVAHGVTPAGTEAPVPPAGIDTTVPPAGPPGAAAAVAAGVEAPQTSLGRDVAAIQEDLQNLTQQRRSLDAASPDQKASLEWREESQRIDEELARVTQEAAAPSPIPGAAAPSAAAGPTLPSPPVAAGVEAKPPAGAAAPGEAVAKAKMTLDELKARAADPTQTPTIDALNQAIKEYKDQHGLKKLPEHSDVTKAWSEGKTKATKAASEQKQAEQKAAREVKRTRAAEEKLQRKQAKVEKKGETEQVGLAQKQAKGYAKLAREQAQKVTQAGKAPTETPPDAAKAKAPGPEKATAPAEAKPGRDTTPPPPPDEKADPDLIRRKLGLKPLGAQEVTHGKAAEPVIAKLTEERQLKAAQAWDPQTRRQTKEAKTAARSAAKAASREDQTNIRESTAKQTLEDHKPGANYAAELAGVEASLKEGKADSPEVKSNVAQVVADVREMVADYKDRVTNLAGGKDHPVFRYAKGKGFEVTKAGKEKAASKARSGKGEYHNFLGEMGNYLDKVEAALKKGDDTRAKDLTLRYLENSRLVREGDIAKVTETRQQASDSVGSQKKKNAPSEAQLRLGEEELAKIKFEEDQAREADARTTRQMTDEQLRQKGMPVPKRDKDGKITGWLKQEVHGQDHSEYVNGVRHVADDYRVGSYKKAIAEMERNLGRRLDAYELARLGEQLGHDVRYSTLGEIMAPHRPDNPIMGAVFDAVHDMVKDMPAYVMSADMLQAIVPNARGAYHPKYGTALFRPDTLVDRTVFHEALHAATARALYGSQRLQHLVTRLQDIVERTYKHSPVGQAMPAYQYAINRDGKRVTTHEFLSELFTRQGVRDMVEQVRLRERDIRDLRAEGYAIDKGKTLLGTLWDNFLRGIGFKADRPSAMKVAVDMLQDTFDREHDLRARDTALGLTDIGRIYSDAEIRSLAHDDPVHGTAAHRAMLAGNKLEAMTALMEMNERGTLSEKSADIAVDYLKDVNRGYWGDDVLPEKVTLMSSPEAVRSGVDTFMDSRLGTTTKNWGWQFNNKFATPLRKFVSGMQYTNDIGRNLEAAFQAVLQPLKDAWSKRENFAQKYMEDSGANKLIDDIAKMKHAIKDRQLWVDFERLMIRESYARTRADEELGVGNNAHIKIGDLRDRQSVKDHATNRRLLESIQARNPELIALRNRIFDFTRDELNTRQKASVRDMLLKMGVAKSGDEVAISGFTKDIMRQNKTITAAERNAMDRVLRLGKENDAWKNWETERSRLEHTVGKSDPAYKKHEAKQTKILTTLASREYENYKKNRDDVRKVVDFEAHHGPHVPFMRHGNHAVYTEFHITPDPSARYNEVKPADPNDLHKQYDFAKLEDAEKFIDETLGHEDVNITVTNAHEVVYDKATGEQAAHWTVEKPDRTATTYTSREAAEAAMEKGDTISKRLTTSKDIDQMRDSNQPTDHLEVRHRVVFNPTEFVKFESEREAHEYRDRLNRDSGHVSAPGLEMRTTRPRLEVKVSNVESAHEMVGRANVAYTSAEMKQWINRQEASPEYQRMDPSEQAEWSRKLRVQAAHVTATAGRRTAHMPREYARGASTDILKNMIEYAGSNSRAVADLTYRDAIDKGLEGAEGYVAKYRNQSGGLGKDHRARDDAMVEIKKRLFAPPRVEDSWATAIKRGLQVSMISHLADTGYLIVNAIEPWVFGAAITASRHGWAGAYREQIAASKLIDPVGLAKAAGKDMAAAFRGEFGANPYERMLLASVRGEGNIRGDGERLAQMLQHMFDKGLAARDVGMEVERIHDPSANVALRGLDWMDNLFRGANTGVETFNRASTAVANYRLEYQRALKEVHSLDAAHEQAVRYAEDMVFKGAGDYGAWNNPRYFNNPFLKLAGQFKKYPLRIASVYADAMMGAVKGDPQKAKQLAYMLIAQSVAAGGMGLPILSPAAGLINAAYILGLSDGNMDDAELWMRKRLVDMMGVDATDLAMHGALRFSGADFSSKMSQSSFMFMGSPDSRKPGDLIKTVALALLGAPGDSAKKGLEGIQKIGEGLGDMSAGAETQGMTKGMEGMAGVMQIKFITNIAKAISMATGGPSGLPKGTEATGGEIAATALGFKPTSLADKAAAKRATNREKKLDSEWRKVRVDRWLGETDPTRQKAIWEQIQKEQAGKDPRLRIKYEDLWKAKQRAKNEARRDDSKLGVKLSGRQKAFADTAGYFNAQ